MRILMVNRGIFRVPPEASGGGAEKHGYYLANHLAKLGHDVCLISKTRGEPEFYPSLKVYRVPPRRAVIPPQIGFFGWIMKHLFGNILSSLVTLRVLVKESYRFDVIHCHGALSALILHVLVGRRIPVVYTMHDPSPWVVYYPGIHRRTFRKLAYLAIDVPCLRTVSSVIAVSPPLREEARRLGSSRSEVIPNAVGIPLSKEERSRSKARYGLFVGHLVPSKRVDILVKAAVRLADEDVRFVVVGDGPERSKLERLAENLGVGRRVTFTGYVDEATLANHYSNAAFFVFPSVAEGLPTVVLEAMSHGLPVIAPRAAMYDGILSHEVNSILYKGCEVDELEKSIRRMISDSDLRQRLSSHAISFAREQFSWEPVARRVLSVYEEVSIGRRFCQAATTGVSISVSSDVWLSATLGTAKPRRKDSISTAVLEQPANTLATAGAPAALVALPEISAIMPAYNEEGKIADCIQSARAHLEMLGRPYEIIVVDDGSTDATRREARKADNNPHVKVVGYSHNRGKGFALKCGVKHATGDVVVFMDSDGDIKPDLVERYVALLGDNDIVLASKRHPDSKVSAPLMRRFLSHGFHCLVILLTGVRVSDTQSGFKAFRREALAKIICLVCVKRYAFDVELLTVAKLLKLRVVELPVKIRLSSLFSARHVARMLVDLLGITYRLRVIHWYQKNLYNARATYKPRIEW